MIRTQLEAMLSLMPVSVSDDSWMTPADRDLTLYVSHDAVALTVSKVQAVTIHGELVQARTHKGEQYVFALADLFALSMEGSPATDRKTGFATPR
ncbi:MAG: hypothetical protein MUF54_10885 [Polyangiaceae bacterium]|jgi:hypothetical protein|nr:hypothetical protein [Polyangiaceae bacterium]